MNYGRAVRIARAAVNMPQHLLASKSNINASYLSQIEKGARIPSTSTVAAVSKALGIPMHIMTLLASEEEELRGLSPDTARRTGLELIHLLRAIGRKERTLADDLDVETA